MTTVELEPSLVCFAKTHSPSEIDIHCDSFYTIKFDKQFDVVSYTDGFGVGDDEDQLLLLKRIANWMKDDACALIDIYQPLYWQKENGQSMRFGQSERKYEYDFQAKRMLDHWWHSENGTERRLKGFNPAIFLDMETEELLFIHTSSWNDFSEEFFKNPNSDLGKVLGAVLLFFLPISITLWFKHKFPDIKRREWSLNWTHHLLNYLAIGLIWGIYTFWENKFGTFHIAAYTSLWLIYGSCQVAYRLKKQEHPRSIQLTIINHLIGTIALVLCLYGF